MPYSDSEGKQEFTVPTLKFLHETRGPIQSVLDVGAGAGTYYDLLKPILPRAKFTAVEIFEPYITQYGLLNKYDEVVLGDIREVEGIVTHDIVILGDVLEHFTQEDAFNVWDKAREMANIAVVLSLPIVVYEQGEMHGNTHEAHLHHWDHQEVWTTLPGITKSWVGSTIGCYLAEVR